MIKYYELNSFYQIPFRCKSIHFSYKNISSLKEYLDWNQGLISGVSRNRNLCTEYVNEYCLVKSDKEITNELIEKYSDGCDCLDCVVLRMLKDDVIETIKEGDLK